MCPINNAQDESANSLNTTDVMGPLNDQPLTKLFIEERLSARLQPEYQPALYDLVNNNPIYSLGDADADRHIRTARKH